jgi:hypothetical protein
MQSPGIGRPHATAPLVAAERSSAERAGYVGIL